MSTAKSTTRRAVRTFGTELPLNSPPPVVSGNTSSKKKSASKQSRKKATKANSSSDTVQTDVVASILKSANVAPAAATPLTSASDARRNLELEGSLERAQQQDQQAATTTTTKKTVRVKKTPRSASSKISTGTRHAQKHHQGEYTVQFAPGPLGMKLEPITTVASPVGTSGGGSSPGTAATHTKMLGCRVVRFVNNSTPTRTTTSQARDFGVIHPGDVVVGIDGVDCSTWEYSRVIELLKKTKKESGSDGNEEEARKAITFRAVGVRKPAVATKSTSVDETAAKDTSSADYEEEDGHMTTIDLNPRVEDAGAISIVAADAGSDGEKGPSSGLFSPSNVKRLRKQKEQLQDLDENLRETPDFRSKGVLLCGNSSTLSAVAGGDKAGAETMTAEQYQGKVSGLLSNVVSQTLLPAVSTVYSNLSMSASVADATVGKIGEALVGHSEQEFQDAIAAKMRLLHELSEIRAALGEDEGTKQEMVSKIDALQKERDDAIKARVIFEEALQTAQREGDELRAVVEATAGELTATKLESVEATANANKLAAQNELLRAQTEQLRGHFGNKEREMSAGLAAAQLQLNERVEAIRILHEQISRYEEQLRIQRENAAASSQELVAASVSAETYGKQLRAEQNALKEANAMIEEMQRQISDLEQSLAEASEKVDAERIEAEERRTIELSKVEDQISKLQGELQSALSAKSSLEDEVARVTSALEGDVGKMQEEMNQVQSDLQDRISELQEKLQEAVSAKSSLEDDVSKIIGEVKEKNAEVLAQKTELEAIQGELQASLSAKTSLENDIDRISGKMEEKNAEILVQQAQMEAQEAEIRELRAKIADGIEGMQKKTDDAAKTWGEKEKELIDELNEQRDRAEEANVELKERIKEFEAKLVEEASAKTLLNEELHRLTDNFAESQGSLEDAKKLIESHELELAKVQKELSTQIQELSRQTADAAVTWRSKEEELTKEIKKQKGLVEEVTDVSRAKEEYYESAMRKLQTRLDAKKEIINKTNQKHAESTAKLELNIDSLKVDIAQKEAHILKMESERNGDSTLLHTQLDAMTSRKEEMEREVESLSAKCKASQKSIDEINEKCERLKSERDMIEIEKQSLASKLSMEANAYSSAKATHKDELQKVKQNAEDQRKVFEEKVDALITEVERVEIFMNREHSRLESHNKDLTQSLAAKNDEIAILQGQLDSTEKKSSQDVESSTAEVLGLRRELSNVRNRLNETEANVEGQERKVVEAQAMIRLREEALCLALLRQHKDRKDFNIALSQRDAQITDIVDKLSTAESQIETINCEKEQDAAAAEFNISHLVEVAEKADIRATEYKALLDDRKRFLESVKNRLIISCEQLEIKYPSDDDGDVNAGSDESPE
jgi:chromosome segregation ATPase